MAHEATGILFGSCLNLIFSILALLPFSSSFPLFFPSFFPSLSIIELLLWSPNVAANNRMKILFCKLFHFHFSTILFLLCSHSPSLYHVVLLPCQWYYGLLIPVSQWSQRDNGNPGTPPLLTFGSPQVFKERWWTDLIRIGLKQSCGSRSGMGNFWGC